MSEGSDIMEERKIKRRANAYNIIRVLSLVVCVGVPLRYIYDGFGHERSVAACIIICGIALAVILILELLVFRAWRKKLDMFAAITEGNMYVRTVDGYRSANDVSDEEK